MTSMSVSVEKRGGDYEMPLAGKYRCRPTSAPAASNPQPLERFWIRRDPRLNDDHQAQRAGPGMQWHRLVAMMVPNIYDVRTGLRGLTALAR